MKAVIVDLTKLSKNEKHAMAEMHVSTYIDERCRYCGRTYTSVQDIREHHVVFAPGGVACKICWEAAVARTNTRIV